MTLEYAKTIFFYKNHFSAL